MGSFNEEYAKKVYGGLIKRGYTVDELGDEAKFVERMGKESNRKILFDVVQRRGNANMGSWDRFNGKMSETPTPQNTFTASELGLDNKDWLALPVEKRTYGETQTPLRPEEPVAENTSDEVVAPVFYRREKTPLQMTENEYMQRVQRGLDERKYDFSQMRTEQGMTAGREDVIKKDGRYYTPIGSYDSYIKATEAVDRHELNSAIQQMKNLYNNPEEWDVYRQKRMTGAVGRGVQLETPKGLIAADRLRGLLSLPKEDVIKIIGEDGYKALQYFDESLKTFGEADRVAWEDANRLGLMGTLGQGFKGIGRGIEYMTGETLNTLSGSSLDDKDVLANWDELMQLRNNKHPYAVASQEELDKIAYVDELAKKYGSLEKAKEEIVRRSKDVSLGDRLKMDAAEAIDNFKPTAKGFGGFVMEMIPNMAGTVLAVGATALTKNPTLGKWIGGINMGALSASTAGNSMKEARDYGASNGQVWAVGLADGAIEFITEKIPFDKITGNVLRTGKKNVAKELSDAVTNNPTAKEEMQSLIKKANKALDGRVLNGNDIKRYFSNVAAEGLSEFSAEALQTMTNMIYQNPEDYPTITDILKNGWEGMKGGLFMGSVMSAVAMPQERKMNDARRRMQGSVDVAQFEIKGVPFIGEVVGEEKNGKVAILVNNEVKDIPVGDIKERHKFAYDQFKRAEYEEVKAEAYEQEPTGAVALSASEEFKTAEMNVRTALGLTNDEDVDAMLEGRTAEEIAMGDSEIEDAVNNYQVAKARFEGIQDKFQDTREEQYRESDNSINARANNGVVFSVTTDNGVVFITGGKVALNDEGEIDYVNSKDLVAMFPDGKKKPVKNGSLQGKVSIKNAEELKAVRRAEIDAKWKADFDNAETAANELQKREAGLLFEVTDELGTHTVEVLEEGADESKILFDGEETPIGTEELNQWREMAGVSQTENGELKTENEEASPENGNVEGESEVAPVVEPIPTETRGKVKRTAYHVVPIERTLDDLESNDLTEDEKIQFAQANIDEINSELQKVLKQEPKMGADIQAYKAAKNQWTVARDEWQKRLDYYNELLNRLKQPVQTSEVAPAVESVAPQATNEMQPVSEGVTEEHPSVAAANSGRDTVGGSPVALAYLLEGGQGSILNAGYFLHGVAAAFPAVGNEIEALRGSMSEDVLGMSPTDFAAQRTEEIAQIGELITNAYGEAGSTIYNELLNNASGFVPRVGAEVGARIEALQPLNESTLSQTSDQVGEQVVDRYTLNSAGNSTQMQKDMEAVRKSNREEYSKIQPAYELLKQAKERGLYPNELEELRAIVKGTSLEGKVDSWFTPLMAEGENAPAQSDVPVNEEVGPFGRIYRQFKGKAKEAIQFLLGKKEGEAVGALSHPEIGDINLVWGEEGTSNSDGYGLAKLAKYHPEVLDNLQEIINDMRVTKRSANRVQLESDTHQAAVRLTWDNKSKNWLLTAFEKKNSVSDNTTDTGETSDGGKQNDTATLQNTVSTDEGTTQSAKVQENTQKSGEDELDIYLAEIKAAQERQKAFAQKSPRPSSFVEAYASNDTEAIKSLDKQLGDALQMLAPMDIMAIETTIKDMKDRKSSVKAGSANERKEAPAYKAFDHIEKALAKRKKQLEKELTEDEKHRIDIIKRGNRDELKESPQPKQENKPVENEPIKDEAPVTSEPTEQPEASAPAEVANDGPVNRETLQLNMSEEDFNALLNSGDKATISEYLAEMDGLLRIGVGSPLDGKDAIVKEYRGLVEQYGGEENIPADVVAGFDERIAPYNALQRAVFDRKYALQDKLREIEANEAQAKEQAEKEAKAEHKKTAFGGVLAGKTDLGAGSAEKALSKKYNFDGKVMTVAEFVEDAVGNGNVKLSAIEEPKYKGASRAAWNRMDARQQEADAKRVKESGTKTVYTVNDHDLGKTAYDYAKFLLDKKAEQKKAAAEQMIRERIEPFAKKKDAEQTTVKIEDVGEKIGGAKKDRFAEGMARIKAELEETDETLTDKLAKLPVSQVFNFDLEKLREGGISNEAISFIKIVKDYLPAKPRKTYKIRNWVNNTLALYKLCLEAGTNWDRVNTLLNGPQFTSSSLKEQFDAYMAIGGFDSGMNIGNAALRQLDNKSGRYDESGKFVTLAGKWYVRDAGKHGGIYDTKEEAVNALKAFAGDKAGVTSSGKKKEVKFAVYQRRQDKSIFIAVKGKSDIVIQDGFKSSKEAFDYIEANNAELQERYRALLDKTNADFEDNRPREGRDYRDGKDIPAEEFRTTFGFRGVEFGNWMTQEDRRKALNECYDALMDLAAVCKVSPQALSLGGTLGMAFGARGGGRFSAHYEPGKLVINLTKTKGAGSLAHEWFHALDNYFAKMGSEGLDVYATAGEGLFPEGISSIGKRYYDRKSGQMLTEEEYNERMNSHGVRREMADAWKSLMETLKKSDYYKRSLAYAGLHNSNYWARPTELGARAFSTWVENELSKQGASNDYLANNPRFLLSEATDEQSRFMPYPFDADATWMEESFGNLFEVMQEKVDEDENAVLYRTAEDIETEYPNWLEGTTTDSGKHSTQVEGTRKTYKKVGDWIEENMGKDVAILDASSGMGYGTADLRERGFNIEDVEPYQSEDRKQNNPATYSSYKDINKQYDYIISNAVLNVIPDDWRAGVLRDMADKLKDGGKMFINTRKAGEEKSIKDKVELDSPREVLVKRNGKIASYQRFFTPQELKEWVESKLGEGYSVEIANKVNSGTSGLSAVVVTKGENLTREGEGSIADQEVVMDSDPYSKALGRPRYTGRNMNEYVARQREKMTAKVQEFAKKLNLDVEVLVSTEGLTGKKAKAKGWYEPSSKRIVVVIPNHASVNDAVATVLHEAVAHHGLRELFGENFDTFLQNVFNNADADVRTQITRLAEQRYNGNILTATEEYLASLAENTDFENATKTGWWEKIKEYFFKMLRDLGIEDFGGITLTDNELRYVLWRSYQNLVNPGMYNNVFAQAKDIAKQYELKVGNYAPAMDANAVAVGEDFLARVPDETIDAVNEFTLNNYGAARVILADGVEDLRELLTVWDFSQKDVEEVVEEYNKGTLAMYMPKYDKVIVFDTNASKDKIIGYLWHENAHKAVGELFTDEEVIQIFKTAIGKDEQEIRNELSRIGYSEAEQAEEYVVRMVEDLVFVKPDLLDGKFKPKKGATEEWKNAVEKVRSIIKYIKNGTEEEYPGGRGGRSRGAQKSVGQSSKKNQRRGTVEVWNSGHQGENAQGTADNTRFRIEENSIDNVPTQPLTFRERITQSVLDASARNKDALEKRADALRMYGTDLKNLLKRMMSTQRWYEDLPKEQKMAVGKELWDVRRGIAASQRVYDKATIDTLVKMAKMYFQNAQLLGHITPYEAGRIMSVLHNATGKSDISNEADKLVNILVDAHTKELAAILDKAVKTKATKVNMSGVEVMGSLDKRGQIMTSAYKNALERDIDSIEKMMIDAEQRMGDPNPEYAKEAQAELEGLLLAHEYKKEIEERKQEIKDLGKELEFAERDAKSGALDRKAFREMRKETQEAVLESKLEIIDAYHNLIRQFSEGLRESSARAKAFRQAQIDRVKDIQYNANSDMEGRPADIQTELPKRWNSWLAQTVLAPFGTLQQMLKKFGEKSVDGKGYLYNRFMPLVTKASDREFRKRAEARLKLNAKLSEIFGKKMKYADLLSLDRKMPGMSIRYINGSEYDPATQQMIPTYNSVEMSQGQLLYLYMINKMSDGRMKLRKMGITEEVMAEVKEMLDERFIKFADWVQDSFLKDKRAEYNEVYERLFGAPMAAIENYFPIKVKKSGLNEAVDVAQQEIGKPSTITGSVIKRTKNTSAIDLSANAFNVLMDHIDDMEHWAAFAELNRDINTLLSYKHFRNQVKNMSTVRYGSGETLWKNFENTARIATQNYKPKTGDIDKAVVNLTKAVSVSKINFRVYTALKQLLSAPAFWTEGGFKEFVKAYAHPVDAWNWAIDNLPGFKERWEGRMAGNERLKPTEKDWTVWRNKWVEKATRGGMWMNAFIDAHVVSVGAKAVFDSKFEELKNAGYTEEKAKEKALQAAAEVYNESQQSSEGAYLSAMQMDRTLLSAALTTFKNSNFGYTRKTAQAIANLSRKTKKGYKEEAIAFMTKQLVRDGLTEEQAKAYAERMYKRSTYKDAADVAMYGFALNILWALGGKAIYLLFGDDDEEKKDMALEALGEGLLGPVQGVGAGDAFVNLAKAAHTGEWRNFSLPGVPAISDVENIAQLFSFDAVRGATELLNMLVAAGVGVNPAVFTEVYAALADAEGFSPEELGLIALRFMSAPTGQVDQLLLDKAMENSGEDLENIMQRYAEYKMNKNTPITQWGYSDEGEQKAMMRYMKRFDTLLGDRLENVVENETAFKMFYDNAEPLMKAKLAKERQMFLEKDKDTAKTFEKMSAEEMVNSILWGKKPDNEIYYGMANMVDVDEDYFLKHELAKFKKIYDAGKDLDSEAKAKYYSEHKREIDMYQKLRPINNFINARKKDMMTRPNDVEDLMTKIRGGRTEAIKLINDYGKK